MTTVQVSPQCLLLSGWILTNVQVNITTAIYDTGHTLIYVLHHTISSIHVLLYTSSILLGRLAVLHFLCPLHLQSILYYFKSTLTLTIHTLLLQIHTHPDNPHFTTLSPHSPWQSTLYYLKSTFTLTIYTLVLQIHTHPDNPHFTTSNPHSP
jgi:hypothetical protein